MNLILGIMCNRCHRRFTVEVDSEDLKRWEKGTFIQNAMPYLSPAERELLISQTCNDCWQEMFPPEED
jgi:hypothetical protein